MTHVDFYFDPSCPWCWITSRWLHEVATLRNITVGWKSYSLALKNEELDGDDNTPHAHSHRESHQLLRMIEAVRADKDDYTVGRLYTALGNLWHNQGRKTVDIAIDALTELGLAGTYVQATKDTTWDAPLQESLDEATKIVGDDVGQPLLVFDTAHGKQGYFGPVISELPDRDTCLALWDGLVQLATVPNFYELKRTRNVEPDIDSTNRLFD